MPAPISTLCFHGTPRWAMLSNIDEPGDRFRLIELLRIEVLANSQGQGRGRLPLDLLARRKRGATEWRRQRRLVGGPRW
jgi:hypothetical protein